MTGAFETAASWLEFGTPEALALGEEIYELLDGLSEAALPVALAEVAAVLDAAERSEGR
ncbi:hypothetical protein [Streptomyces scabiei]|uniref:hypothetical protein n=1 Tax=Streptomyces scabiei TaxID=1930 RepID=UPI0029A03AF6|nr:hypothetical protein [Streptomyces scabiei]MDX3279100.1 hypothetical protein [Streptomyces scabiei]